MKCPNCGGTGVIHFRNIHVLCGKCKGIGFIDDDEPKPKKQMTEQEYLQTCNTEQLAEEIYGFVWCSSELWQRLCCSGDGTDKESDLKIVREWLKQPHRGE